MLSDHEQRALDEIERCYSGSAGDPARSGPAAGRGARRPSRPPGRRVALVLASVSAVLFVAGVPVAALAVALATGIGWLFWLLVVSHGRGIPVGPVPGLAGLRGPGRRAGGSLREYLRWLSEAE